MNINKASELLALLSDQSRLTIIKALQKNKKMIGVDLLKLLNCGQPTLSHHMNCMKEAGLIKASKKGNKIFYSINNDIFNSLLNYLYKSNEQTIEQKENIGIEPELEDKVLDDDEEIDVPVYLL